MRTTRRLAVGGGFAIDELRIVRDTSAWTKPEPLATQRLVFVRRGVFRLRLGGWDGVADPMLAYAGQPGDEHSIAHRPGVEDVCTVITLADRYTHSYSDARGPIRTTARSWLAHRVLVARARNGAEEFELAERVAVLAADLLRQPPRPAAVDAAHRRLAHAARERLAADPATLTLDALARDVGASRSHLSRVFRRVTGETLTRFRNRLRVRLALDRIEAGETDLARLAADLGFADHAHLTRTVRAETGVPPRGVRQLLSTDLQAGRDLPLRG
ncbi:helix-turn-helix domain-containing protein [Flindersiella endophytica]